MLYEPSLFTLIDATSPQPNAAAGVRDSVAWAASVAKLAALGVLEMPVLLMQGGEPTESARAVAALLSQTLPQVTALSLAGLVHMGPITHPATVNAAIVAFLLQRHPGRSGHCWGRFLRWPLLALSNGQHRQSKLVQEVDQKGVDRHRTFALYPVPRTFQDVAATQARQGLAEVVDLRL